MAVNDCCGPTHLFWSHQCRLHRVILCFPILIELSLDFLSGDHTFAHPFNEVVFLGIIIMCCRWKVGDRPVRHWLVGLDLFNDDTCPSGHISRPTQVNVSQELLSFSKKPSYTGTCVSELLSFSKQLLKSDHIVHAWGLVEVNRLHHIR